MVLDDVLDRLWRIDGAAVATLDAVTVPSPGIKKVTAGERAILFGHGCHSGYETLVKSRLAELGRDPGDFAISDLPWGIRLEGTPIIQHAGRDYLQTILLSPGDAHYYIGDIEVTAEQCGIKRRRTNQGLPQSREVVVNTYLLSSITRLTLEPVAIDSKEGP